MDVPVCCFLSANQASQAKDSSAKVKPISFINLLRSTHLVPLYIVLHNRICNCTVKRNVISFSDFKQISYLFSINPQNVSKLSFKTPLNHHKYEILSSRQANLQQHMQQTYLVQLQVGWVWWPAHNVPRVGGGCIQKHFPFMWPLFA